MTDRDSGYRDGIEATDKIAILKYKMFCQLRSDSPHEELRKTWGAIERLLGAPLPSTPDDGKAEVVGRYSISIAWSDEDQAFIATIPELPGCTADGETRSDALTELAAAQAAWIDACNSAGNPAPGFKPYTHPSPASDGAIRPSALEALRSYEQADADGVMVLVSRQALDEAINALSAHAGDAAKESGDKQLCAGGIDPGFDACPKCGATDDEHCQFDGPPDTHAEVKNV